MAPCGPLEGGRITREIARKARRLGAKGPRLSRPLPRSTSQFPEAFPQLEKLQLNLFPSAPLGPSFTFFHDRDPLVQSLTLPLSISREPLPSPESLVLLRIHPGDRAHRIRYLFAESFLLHGRTHSLFPRQPADPARVGHIDSSCTEAGTIGIHNPPLLFAFEYRLCRWRE